MSPTIPAKLRRVLSRLTPWIRRCQRAHEARVCVRCRAPWDHGRECLACTKAATWRQDDVRAARLAAALCRCGRRRAAHARQCPRCLELDRGYKVARRAP